jgi:hypothetical protein
MCGVCYGLRDVNCLTCGRKRNNLGSGTIRASEVSPIDDNLGAITADMVLDAHEAMARQDHWTFIS